MQLSVRNALIIGGGATALGAAARIATGHVLDTPAKREQVAPPLNLGGAAAGIAGLAIAGLGPAALRPLGIGLGIAGAAAFIGSQLLLPHGFSPSAE